MNIRIFFPQVVIVLGVFGPGLAPAQFEHRPPGDPAAREADFKSCVSELGLQWTRSAAFIGSKPALRSEDRVLLQACLKQKRERRFQAVKQKVDQCLIAQGLTPPAGATAEGPPPDLAADLEEAIGACMERIRASRSDDSP